MIFPAIRHIPLVGPAPYGPGIPPGVPFCWGDSYNILFFLLYPLISNGMRGEEIRQKD